MDHVFTRMRSNRSFMAGCKVILSSIFSFYRTVSRTSTLLKRQHRALRPLLSSSWRISSLPAVQHRPFTMEPTPGTGVSIRDKPVAGKSDTEEPEVGDVQGIGAVALDEKPCDSDEGSHDKVEKSACDVGGKEDTGDETGDERYAYVQRGFTTEIYKIEVTNLPDYVGYKVQI